MVQIWTEVDGPAFDVIESLRNESVVTVTGKVVARAPAAVNPTLPTGEVEIRVAEAVVPSGAQELPLTVHGGQEYAEGARRSGGEGRSGEGRVEAGGRRRKEKTNQQ